MKKLQILLPMAAVLLTLTGCKKDNEKSVTPGETVTLTATLGGGEKTEIYNGTKMKWSEGDAVAINETPYIAELSNENKTATFYSVERDKNNEYRAYYPASLYKDGKYVLPQTQEYDGNKLSLVSPMYAETDTKELHFYHICALMKLEVTGKGTIKRIVVTSDDPLCGEFTVEEKPESKSDRYYAKVTGGFKAVTLYCGDGVTLKENEATTFYIALPQGSLRNLKFTLRDSDGGKWEAEAIPVATLTAGKIYTKPLEEGTYTYPSVAGALFDEFSVSATKKVYFSKGNLQYNATGASYEALPGENVGGTWRFADNQYDYIGADNKNASATYTGWIDLFGWGTSGYAPSGDDPYYEHYQPWSTSVAETAETETNLYHYGPSFNMVPNNLTGKSDWGYNAISDGGNAVNSGWYTLDNDEWKYLFNKRNTTYSNRRYAEVKVDGKAGILLFPDQFSWPTSIADKQPETFNTYDSNWNGVDYSVEEFNVLQTAGCVFLPAAGRRGGTSINVVGSHSYYWSSTPHGATGAYFLYFYSDGVNPANGNNRSLGRSVRLVLPVEN